MLRHTYTFPCAVTWPSNRANRMYGLYEKRRQNADISKTFVLTAKLLTFGSRGAYNRIANVKINAKGG